jgi:hypothetical protein
LGATEISRDEFKKKLQQLLPAKAKTDRWELRYNSTESLQVKVEDEFKVENK